jgi:hypothetical protein
MRNPAGSKTAASHAVDYSTASALERPVPTPVSGPKFGSDAVAEALRALDIPYIVGPEQRRLIRRQLHSRVRGQYPIARMNP